MSTAACAIQVDYWFEEITDEMAEEVAASGLPALVGRLRGLKPFPRTALRLLELAGDPGHATAEIVRVIEGDPGIASRVLRAVNSAAFGLPSKCASVARGVTLLGARTISEIASAFAMFDMFSATGPAAALREHALAVAALGRALATDVRRLRGIDLFTCGLMHDLGKLLMLQVDQGQYEPMLAATAGAGALHQGERDRYGYDHALLGAHLLAAWNVPEPVPKAVAWHHQIARALSAGGDIADIVAVVAAADELAYLPSPTPDPVALEALAGLPAFRHLGLDAVTLCTRWEHFARARADVADLAK